MDSDTITMPPFFFYVDEQRNTQLAPADLMACYLVLRTPLSLREELGVGVALVFSDDLPVSMGP